MCVACCISIAALLHLVLLACLTVFSALLACCCWLLFVSIFNLLDLLTKLSLMCVAVGLCTSDRLRFFLTLGYKHVAKSFTLSLWKKAVHVIIQTDTRQK